MPNRPQVVIRIVPGGGTRSIQQIINQWQYLSRKGQLALTLSGRHLEVPLPPDRISEFAKSWVRETGNYDDSIPDEDRHQDLTTHIVVSFPVGTDPDAAQAAAREWALVLFGSGEGGGRYNYLTVFHTDRDHPHLHVVVNRRELLGRDWLKISRRHPHLNYTALRERMAEISLRHGIFLEATRRTERGIRERPMTYAEYRRLEREQAREIHLDHPGGENDDEGVEEDVRTLSPRNADYSSSLGNPGPSRKRGTEAVGEPSSSSKAKRLNEAGASRSGEFRDSPIRQGSKRNADDDSAFNSRKRRRNERGDDRHNDST